MTVGMKGGHAFRRHRQISRSGTRHHHPSGERCGRVPHHGVPTWPGGGDGSASHRRHALVHLGGVGPAEHHSDPAAGQFRHDGSALLGCLARSVHRLGHTLAQRPVMVDQGKAEIGHGELTYGVDEVIGVTRPRNDIVDEGS